ncbi:hypothetical protein ACN469_26325 [Corallococcus terminator]
MKFYLDDLIMEGIAPLQLIQKPETLLSRRDKDGVRPTRDGSVLMAGVSQANSLVD